MPEIKNTFTSGKMNKDLDERLVPNGEYRDAMNIQLSTSEDSNVGAIENILGNDILMGGTELDAESYCVGSVADEKNNALYWLIAGPTYLGLNEEMSRDMILQYKDSVVTPVLVDIYRIRTLYGGHDSATNTIQVTTQNDPNTALIEVGMVVQFDDAFNQVCYFGNNPITNIVTDPATGLMTITLQNSFNVAPLGGQSNVASFIFSKGTYTDCDSSPSNVKKVLNFHRDNLVTGLNVLDGFLIFTDNHSEPKKINIQRCIDGSNGFDKNTRLVVPQNNITINDNILLQEHHVTAIKKSPKTSLIVNPKFDVPMELISGAFGAPQIDFAVGTNTLLEVGDQLKIGVKYLVWNYGEVLENGQEIRFLSGGSSGSLPNDFEVRAKIIAAHGGTGPYVTALTANNDPIPYNLQPDYQGYYSGDAYTIEIISIASSTPNTRVSYDIMRPVVDNLLFEKKFPRFSYRWKYTDGEYSTFAPFTDVVFAPGQFGYSSTSPFNTGMESLLVSVELRDFLPYETPEDVVQVDLLYKESNSPIVYSVDKIRKYDQGDIEVNGVSNLNNWDANQYKLTSDLIYAALPSNQLLRPWDNLPRKALAQEVSGNRIIYGNYLQNFNVEKPILQSGREPRFLRRNNNQYLLEYTFDGNDTRKPILQLESLFGIRGVYLGHPSLKSLREYQVGVTFMDKYGRETPVFSNPESTFSIPKSGAASKVKITTEIKTPPPSWAEYFKFYVKETSTEYYNLAMDRWYKAEDNTLWLSFPSSERNKVDEETFLILKKQADTNTYIKEKAKYKILAISNEAPDYIKSRTTLAGSLTSTDTRTALSTSQPVINQRYFEIDEDIWTSSGGAKLNELVNDTLSLDFAVNNTYSKRYDIISLNVYPDQGVNGGNVYRLRLDRPLEEADQDLLYPNFPTILSNNLPDFRSGLSLKVYKTATVEDPEFAGKFFVKIEADGITDQYVTATDGDTNYEILARANTYHLLDGYVSGGNGGTNVRGGNPSNGNTTGYTDHYGSLTGQGALDDLVDRVENNLDFNDPEDNDVDSEWFIDQVFYAGTYPLISTEQGGGGAVFASMSNTYPGYNSNKLTYNKPYNDSGYGQGIFEHNGQWYIELAFSAIEPRIGGGEIPFFGDGGNKTPNFSDFNENYIWAVGSGINPDSAGQAPIVNQLVEGSKFRFAGDTNGPNGDGVIYTINAPVQVERRINHTRYKIVDDRWNTWGNQQPSSYPLNSDWSNPTYTDYRDAWRHFGRANNRRVTYIIPVDKDPTTSSSFNPVGNAYGNATSLTADDNTAVGIEFITQRNSDDAKLTISKNPAIWETEPKESVDLNLYHEASQAYPINLNGINNNHYVPAGSILTCPNNASTLFHHFPPYIPYTYVVRWNSADEVVLNQSLNTDINTGQLNMAPGETFIFNRADESYTSMKIIGSQVNTPSIAPQMVVNPNLTTGGHFYLEETTYKVNTDIFNNRVALSYFNCYSFSNGVESNRIRDTFNQVVIDKGARVSTVLDDVYEEERRSSGLIFSGIYNTNSGVNNLNQFIQAEKITKDLNPTYGSVQKLFSRQTDLVTFCEDRVVKVLANKDAVFNADGNPQLTANQNVLGQTMPFSGDYGISKNPESFAVDNYRAYFTDKQRSAVLRLSMDGLTNISDYGMGDWFGDNMKQFRKLIGSYDTDKQDYNLTLAENYSAFETEHTISYSEDVKGWVSFKSFIPESGVSMNNDYFTFKNGYIHIHHQGYVDHNTFYGDFTPSSVDVLLNAEPGSVKNYQTLNYEGSKSKITIENLPPDVDSNEYEGYKKLISKDGWYTDTITTNKQKGHVNEFIEKEGKWFNYIKGNTVINNMDIKTEEFSFQGIGRATSVPKPVYGCMDSNAINYEPLATVDDGSCTYPFYGCCDKLANNEMNPPADNITRFCDNTLCTYDPSWNCDTVNGGIMEMFDGTGIYNDPVVAANNCPLCGLGTIPGCMTQTDPVTGIDNINYDPTATCDDGSCDPCVMGCIDGTINTGYGFPDIYGNCVGGVSPDPSTGLCDPNQGYVNSNYDPNATCNDGNCLQGVGGCIDPLADNYSTTANYDDGSCYYCNGFCGCTHLGDNPDVNGDCLDGTNVGYPNPGGCGTDNGYHVENYTPGTNPGCMDANCTPACVFGCTDPNATNYYPGASYDDGSCAYIGCVDPTALNYDPNATIGAGMESILCCGGSYGNLGCGDCSSLNYDGDYTGSSFPGTPCHDPSLCNYPDPSNYPTAGIDPAGVYLDPQNTTWVFGSSTSMGVVDNVVEFFSTDAPTGTWFDVWRSPAQSGPNQAGTIGSTSFVEFVPNDTNISPQIIYTGATIQGKNDIYNLIANGFKLPLYSLQMVYDQVNGVFHNTEITGRLSTQFGIGYQGDNGKLKLQVMFNLYDYYNTPPPGLSCNDPNNPPHPNLTLNDEIDLVWGCMDNRSSNYNSLANIHDLSC